MSTASDRVRTPKAAMATDNSAPPTITTAVIDADLQNASLHRFSAPPLLTLTVSVANTGSRASPVSVLAFVAGPSAGRGGEPIRELVGFEKVELSEGQSAEVSFTLGAWELSSTDAAGRRRAMRGQWTVMVEDTKQIVQVADPVMIALKTDKLLTGQVAKHGMTGRNMAASSAPPPMRSLQ